MLGERPAGERGQLLVITALVLAIVLVGLALVLNSAIYTENLSSRESTDSSEATTALGSGEAEIERAIRHVNLHNNSSHDEANRALDAIVSDVSNDTTDQHAKLGASYRFSVVSRRNGTHLRHTNESKSFVSGGTNASKSEWWLAKDVPRLRSYEMTTQRGYLYEGTTTDFSILIDNAFRIQLHGEDADGNSIVWEIYAYNETTDGNVTIFGGKAAEINGATDIADLTMDSCPVDVASDTEDVVLDITNNTVNGDYCESLDFGTELVSVVDIRYENADDDADGSRSGGTYEVAIGTTSYQDQHFYDSSGSQSPFATHIIYDVRVESHYSRNDITHSRVVRIQPGAVGYTP